MARSPASVIVDSSGNLVGVVLDGTTYRLQVDAKLSTGDSDLVVLDATDGGPTLTVADESTHVLLRQVLLELRKLNFMISHATDMAVDDGDV